MTYKFYIAGCGNKSVEKTIRKHNMYRLLSWVNERKVIEDRCRSGYSTFVDSGAFSAATRGLQINVDEYIETYVEKQDLSKYLQTILFLFQSLH